MPDVEHSLHPIEVGALVPEQIAHPIFDEAEVEEAVLRDAHRADRRVVLVLAVRVEELGVHLERPLQVECADVEHPVDRHVRLLAALDLRGRVPFLNHRGQTGLPRLLHARGDLECRRDQSAGTRPQAMQVSR